MVAKANVCAQIATENKLWIVTKFPSVVELVYCVQSQMPIIYASSRLIHLILDKVRIVPQRSKYELPLL
jgi:hypothetical protein